MKGILLRRAHEGFAYSGAFLLEVAKGVSPVCSWALSLFSSSCRALREKRDRERERERERAREKGRERERETNR